MSTVQELENSILVILRSFVFSHGSQLAGLGLRPEIIIDRRSSEDAGYSSEIRAEFLDENGIWDILEFEVVKKGIPVTSLEEVEKWVPDAFASVLARRELEGGTQIQNIQ